MLCHTIPGIDIGNVLQAQNPGEIYPSFQHLTVEDGLPSNNIYCLFKDSRGFLWVGTEDGAARFDGITFSVFKHNPLDSNSLVYNIVESIVEDAEGNIWFGTYGGVSCYHQKENRFENFVHQENDNSLSHNHVGDIVVDMNGGIWLGTYEGLNEFISTSREFRRYDFDEKIEVTYVSHLAYDNHNTLWMNGKKTLLSFDIRSKQFTRYSHDAESEHFNGSLVNDLLLDGPNTLWVCTWGAGLRKFDIQTGRYLTTYKYSIDNARPGNTNIVRSAEFQVLPSMDTVMWIATAGNGIGIFDRRSEEFSFRRHDISDARSVSSNETGHLLYDENGILWVATNAGIDRYDIQSQRIRTVKFDMSNVGNISIGFNLVLGLTERNEIWLSTPYREGVFRYDEMTGVLLHLSLNSSGTAGSVQSILSDSQKRLWVCTTNGIYLYDPFKEKFTCKNEADGLYAAGGITSMEEYAPGKFVLGVNHLGVVMYDESIPRFDTIRVVRDTTQALTAEVYDVAVDDFGHAWIATREGAFATDVQNGTVRRFSVESEPRYRIGDNTVFALGTEWSRGMWIGTNLGLYFYDHVLDTTYSYNTSDGLAHEIVHDVYHDSFGKVWIATRNGLSKYDRDQNQFSTYTMADGLLGNSIYSALLGTEDGRIFIGGTDGYNWYYSNDLEPNVNLPPVVITAFELKGKPYYWETQLDKDSVIHFKYHQNDFSFEFAALNFTNAVKNQYAYRLIGYDDVWKYSGKERRATYTNLGSGDYVFEVKGTNNDGVWSNDIARVMISIAPPFWKTNWFYALCAGFGISMVYGVFRMRTADLRRQKLALELTVEKRTYELKEQKELADQHRIRAEQSEKFQEQFLANMSHEIRTPMNTVMGMTNLLIDKSPRREQMDYLEGIKKSSETLLYIINDILDLSKIEAGKIELEKIDFSIREIIDQVEKTLRHLADEKNILFTTSINEDVGEIRIGDPVRINQVLMNLAGNAIKFTEAGSVAIHVSAGTDNEVVFVVTDTGIGIPKEKLQSIFESFTQAHTSDTRRFGGTGLGLSISKQLVALMDGTITVDSEVGFGSTFSFVLHLPAGSAANLKNQKTAERIDGSILNGLKILLVDDNEYNRIVAADTLQSKAELSVDSASNGIVALNLLKENEYDVILMDIQMPEMDGFEATRHIRNPKSEIRNHHVPIIALTASVFRTDLEAFREVGMNGYVPKPFKTFQLISAIANATGREIRFLNAAESPAVDDLQHIPITNLAYLETFCEGDQERMQKYIHMFLESAPGFKVGVESALASGDLKGVASLIHGYKMNWLMMGMTEAGTLATRIEQRVREHPEEDGLKQDTAKLLSLVERATKELPG